MFGAKQQAEPSKNTIFTEDAAEKARQILKAKLGQINSGIDPEIMQAGITLAGYHIEKGARTFAAYARAMVDDLGDVVKPYLKSWYFGVKYDPRAAEFSGMDDAAAVDATNIDTIFASQEKGTLADAIYAQIGDITDNRKLKAVVAEYEGIPASDVTDAMLKSAQESMELALVRQARETVAEGLDTQATYRKLVDQYLNQPNLSVRSSTSMENMAYSTPAPIAYLASNLAGITPSSTVYEPTAGNGMLLIAADPGNTTVNELNDFRRSQLQEQGFAATGNDATTFVPKGRFDSVIMNPPFGRLKNDDGSQKVVKIDGYQIKAIDHLIAAKALESMKDDGRAVMIIGASKAEGDISPNDRTFFNWLYSRYNVVDHFEVEGDLYKRQGAGWPIRVITINGRVRSDNISPVSGSIERVRTWDEVYERYQEGMDASQRPVERPSEASADDVRDTNTKDGRKSAPVPTEGQANPTDERSRAGRAESDADATGSDRGSARTGKRSNARAERERAGRDANLYGLNTVATGRSGLQQDGNQSTTSAKASGDANTGKPAGKPGTGNQRKPSVSASSFQAPYETRSKGSNENVLTPINMADASKRALAAIEAEVGNLDQYVADKLGYDSVEAVHDAFMGLQVDTIAAGIYNAENGKGIIIADQTGVGKGRQAAGMIRYALRTNQIPIFITVKDNLFTDMFNDLADIGSNDVSPLILNQDGFIRTEDGGRLYDNPVRDEHVATMQEIISNGSLPEGKNALFLTYSQVDRDNIQRKVIEALGDRAMFVLDESHNAAGDRVSIKKGGIKRKTTAGFIYDAINNRPVVYLSATYAKTPKNMPVYYRTDLLDAVDTVEELVTAVEEGGAPLQTVMAGMLAESGQLWRRERSFDGIEIKTIVDLNNTEEHTKLADQVTQGLRAIVAADRHFHEVFVGEYAQQIQQFGGDAFGAGNRAKASVDHINFNSIVHNFIAQMLLGLKAKSTAEQAIELHKKGVKPVVALENTMGTFLRDYVQDTGLSVGDVVDIDYRDVLLSALDGTRRISIKSPMGEPQTIAIPLSDIDALGQSLYREAEDLIKSLDIADLPISPIDYVRDQLEMAGIRTSEITGRTYRIDYKGDKPVLTLRDSGENDRRGVVDGFNGGSIDALVLNAAGSTGLSIHASERFATSQQPRHMLVMQAMGDINILMQMLGRINRTGQVKLPSYSMLGVNLPAEKRPLARTSNKMKSLNANTSANTDSDTSIDAPDLMNKYGDQIVTAYLRENPDVAMAVDMSPGSEETAAMGGAATRFTGRLALLPVARQAEIYAEIESAYNDLIEYLNKTNQNDLVPTTIDLDASIIESRVVYEGKNPESTFGGHTVLHKVDAKYQGKPPTADEVSSAIDKALKEGDANQLAGKIISQLANDPGFDEYVARERAEINAEEERILKKAKDQGLNTKVSLSMMIDDARASGVDEKIIKRLDNQVSSLEMKKSRLGSMIRDNSQNKETLERLIGRDLLIGKRARLDLGDEIVTGVVVGVKTSHKKGKGNPYSLSKTRVHFMVNSGIRQIELPLTRLTHTAGVLVEVLRGQGKQGLDSVFSSDLAGENRREVRYLATGNLIAGSAKLKGGRIVTFTDQKGEMHQGILMPKRFNDQNFAALGESSNYALRDPEVLVKFLKGNTDLLKGFGVFNAAKTVKLMPDSRGGWQIIVPKSNKDADGRNVKFDSALRAAMGADFFGSGKEMSAKFSESRLDKVVPALMEIVSLKALPSTRDAWVQAGGNAVPTAPKTFGDDVMANSEIVSFYPKQIKSATDNVCTFDPTNPDIRFRRSDLDSTSTTEGVTNDPSEAVNRLNEALRRSGETADTRSAVRESLTGGKRQAAEFAEAIAQQFGVQINWVTSSVFDGVHHAGNIFVNVDSSAPYHVVLGHELVHTLKQTDPDLYAQLEALIMPETTATQASAEFHRYGEGTINANEEYVADVVSNRFGEKQFWRDMAAAEPILS